ncbi:RsmF rRNA methyltransferase first C-terminal domain-containing protein [Effusibacillus lacus]|uniref:RNA methyltransferase n=1 Tax=Effusibacillus lacus TaxID=1348429 RepID=A0A292YDV3_9BACL|nr:RsmB/NOP family class I SAM-dependent RNA methyltransferase [Effusibacillus lacus]TCS70624.1 NOL1/NOP2/sun family putative RNA methylase [Effusibacillus lacus]GAX90622.1 RNA methyltransferase [Effusibacillus lacus]
MKGLPQPFISRMSDLLGTEYELFSQSYENPKTMGLRVNTLKISAEEFLAISPFRLEPVPWAPEGFYYEAEESPGKHVYHTAGLYYIQEPSAMAIAPGLAPEPGERVLDLCAAPGGKTTHLAAYMKGRGILVANEFVAGRAKVLAENVERLGVRNAVIFNEHPAKLAAAFPGWFDRILVDAPCSGEGMFRKDPAACEEWSLENVVHCAIRQLDILEEAAKMLRPGGKLVYSTCTFSPEENESVLDRFLDTHPEFRLLPFPNASCFSPGRPEWGKGRPELQHAVRLWPHRIRGEGHFSALLEKTDGAEPGVVPLQTKVQSEAVSLLNAFMRESLMEPIPGTQLLLQGENLYSTPGDLPDVKRLKWVRPGLHLGEVKKKRFEPSHTLAMTLSSKEVVRFISLQPDDPEVARYLRGETLSATTPDGWTLVCVHQFPLGWGKVVNGTLKNHYPKGLRIP